MRVIFCGKQMGFIDPEKDRALGLIGVKLAPDGSLLPHCFEKLLRGGIGPRADRRQVEDNNRTFVRIVRKEVCCCRKQLARCANQKILQHGRQSNGDGTARAVCKSGKLVSKVVRDHFVVGHPPGGLIGDLGLLKILREIRTIIYWRIDVRGTGRQCIDEFQDIKRGEETPRCHKHHQTVPQQCLSGLVPELCVAAAITALAASIRFMKVEIRFSTRVAGSPGRCSSYSTKLNRHDESGRTMMRSDFRPVALAYRSQSLASSGLAHSTSPPNPACRKALAMVCPEPVVLPEPFEPRINVPAAAFSTVQVSPTSDSCNSGASKLET